jgi:ribosomal protein S26
MRKFITILLFVGVLLQSLSKLVVIVNFELKKDFIAKNLCENRDKPKLCCKGKCQLKKALNNTENDSPKNKTSQRINFDEFVPVYASNQIIKSQVYHTTAIKSVFISQQYCFDPPNTIFHPPQA